MRLRKRPPSQRKTRRFCPSAPGSAHWRRRSALRKNSPCVPGFCGWKRRWRSCLHSARGRSCSYWSTAISAAGAGSMPSAATWCPVRSAPIFAGRARCSKRPHVVLRHAAGRKRLILRLLRAILFLRGSCGRSGTGGRALWRRAGNNVALPFRGVRIPAVRAEAFCRAAK